MGEKLSHLIGLTGGIGSGKSSVSSSLSKQTGFFSIDADKIAKDLFSQQGQILDSLKKIIGGKFFLADGTLDRPKLRSAIFSDKKIRYSVEQFVHPLIWEDIKKKAAKATKRSGKFVLVEIPLLFESGWHSSFNKIIVVYASKQNCLERLIKRDMVSEDEAVLACSSQLPLAEKVLLADHVIDNSRSWFDTLLQIKNLSEILSDE